MPDVPDLVALLYRTDWTRLSLSATIVSRRDRAVDRQMRRLIHERNQRLLGPVPKPWHFPEPPYPDADQHEHESRVLLAPGGRYRIETEDGSLAAVSDGENTWTVLGGTARRCPADGPHRAFGGLITPQWLIARYDLEAGDVTRVAGRTALRVTATPRAVPSAADSAHHELLDRVEADVDAGLGVILRSEQVFRGQTLAVSEMRDLVVPPAGAADPARFAPPPGMPVDDSPVFGTFEPHGPGWHAATIAAGAAASAMGFAVRHAPRRPVPRIPGDREPDMPPDARDLAAGLAGAAPPGDDLVNLLHRTGMSAQDFTADLHQWLDADALLGIAQTLRSILPQPLDGILGPDALWEAVADRGRREGGVHRTARLRVSMPGRYRIDYLAGRWDKKYTAIACDGRHTRKLYANRVVTGPVEPLEQEFAALADPAGLLGEWAIGTTGEVSVGGRRGFRVVAEARGWPARAGLGQVLSPVEAIVDAEFGILLRRTSYVDGRPAIRSELRNVTAGTSPADFDLAAAPGLRQVTGTGGPLGDHDLPAPVEAAANAAALAAAGAVAGVVAVTGWLQKRRSRPGRS